MMTYILILIVYILIVNLITSYRLISDDFYNKIQKIIQLIIIWILPLLGVTIIAWFLNQNNVELIGLWKKYPKISAILGKLVFIKITKKDYVSGYSSDVDHIGGTHCDVGGGD